MEDSALVQFLFEEGFFRPHQVQGFLLVVYVAQSGQCGGLCQVVDIEGHGRPIGSRDDLWIADGVADS
jgi:hypothetical protein